MLQSGLSDALNLIGSASGFNLRKLLRLLAAGMYSRTLTVWCMAERFLDVILYRFRLTLPFKQIKY